NKFTNILNELTNKSGLSVGNTRLSNELLETTKMMEHCTSCKDEIGGFYYFEFYKSVNKIEYLLDELDQEQREEEKGNMINDLSDKLIKINSILNGELLCIDCRRKIFARLINKLTNILNELTNKSNLTARNTRLTNELLETSKMMENCTSCKNEIRGF